MVVGHAHGHEVRVCAAGIALGIVCHVIAVLIPVERVVHRVVVDAVGVAFSVALVLEELPSAASDFIGSRCDRGFAQDGEVAGQDDVRLGDVGHCRHATLERQVDVQHMALADRCDVALAVGFVVVILIDDGDNLLL